MELEHCIGRYARLQQELAEARSQRPGNIRKIDRLAEDLVSAGREIADLRPADEQCEEWRLG